MTKELTYLSPEGHTVFTAQFLKNRGTCCKTTCLHCPYGYTLKKCGLTFKDVADADLAVVDQVLKDSGVSIDYKPFLPDNVKLILVKDHVAGVLLKNHIVIKQLILKPHFLDQGLSKEMVESYYFI